MLTKIDLDQSMDKKEYKEAMKAMSEKLADLQQTIQQMQIPVIIVLEGWSASGKGTFIGRVVSPLDPRFFNVYTMGKVNEDVAMRPFLWPFWVRTPRKGRIAIFDKSWHRIALPLNQGERIMRESELDTIYYDTNAFERQLTDDGVVIIKLFLHIGKEEQRKRFRDLEKDEDTAWRVDDDDWKQQKNYDENLKLFERMLKMTHTDENPWHIIEAKEKRFATAKIFRTIIERIEARIHYLQRHANTAAKEPERTNTPYDGVRLLRYTALDKPVDNDVYKKELSLYQKRMDKLGHKLYLKRRPVVIVYEGWDAAGKGGNIKRLTEELDPRCYEVVPISAPTPDELAHHYLWRFYNKLPKDGHFAIYDRSWYGRVLVERVENLTPEPVWRRAYREINEMESHLLHHGTIIFKFWLHIDKEEQLTRFQERQNDPLKQYKITEEDWRNREKWAIYEDAVDEMLSETSMPGAPWTVIESNNKKYARLKVLQTVTTTLENELR